MFGRLGKGYREDRGQEGGERGGQLGILEGGIS